MHWTEQEAKEIQEQVQAITHQVFRRSGTYRDLFQYLVDAALGGSRVTLADVARDVWETHGRPVTDSAIYTAKSRVGEMLQKYYTAQRDAPIEVWFHGPFELDFRFKAGRSSPVDENHSTHTLSSQTLLSPYATVPPLPPTFFERPEISEPLREKVTGGAGIVGITAVEGMGGVGKTLVTMGLCHDPQVRKTFADGIVWLDIGRESTNSFSDQVKVIAHALNAEFGEYNVAEYHSLLENKSVLIVLDDVWVAQDVEPFRMSSDRSRLLYTSRNKELAGPFGAESQDVDVLDSRQARLFLNRWAGREKRPPPEPWATGILDECKGLALGLAMMGAALRGQPDEEWEAAQEDLKQARLKELGRKVAGYRHETIHAAIEVSVNALSPDNKARYLKLAILLENFSASSILLQQLWGGDQRSVQRTMRSLCDRSLARRDSQGIRLHDLQLDYVRGEHLYQGALALERRALQLSIHVIQQWPEELNSQLTGRLLAHQDHLGIAAFLQEVKAMTARPRLRPLWPRLTRAGGSAQAILTGHSDWVNAVSISADGKRAISGSHDHTLRVWDLESLKLLRILEDHKDRVEALLISADGKRAFSASFHYKLWMWDLESDEPGRVLESRVDRVRAAAITADFKRMVLASNAHESASTIVALRKISGFPSREAWAPHDLEPSVWIWDLDGNDAPQVVGTHDDWPDAIAISASGTRVALASKANSMLRVWSLESPGPASELHTRTSLMRAVAISADGKRAVSGVRNEVWVWDLERQETEQVLKGHTSDVVAVAISADSKTAVSGSDDHTVRVWDLEGNEPIQVLEGHSKTVYAVAISANGKTAISGSSDGTARVWNLEMKELRRVHECHADPVEVIAMSADGKRAISSDKKTLRMWDLEGREPMRILRGERPYPPDMAESVAISASGARAVSISIFGVAYVWDLGANETARALKGHEGRPTTVAISADGKRALSASYHTLKVWNLEHYDDAGEILRGREEMINAAVLSADGRRAISYDSRTLHVWDLEGEKPVRLWARHEDSVGKLAISADGKRAVSGGSGHLQIWDLECDEPARVMKFDKGRLGTWAISANFRRAIQVCDGETLRVWDLDRKESDPVLEGHTGPISKVAISANGKRAITASGSTVRVWDLEEWKCLARFTCDAPVSSCAEASGRIMAGDDSGNLHLFAWEE